MAPARRQGADDPETAPPVPRNPLARAETDPGIVSLAKENP